MSRNSQVEYDLWFSELCLRMLAKNNFHGTYIKRPASLTKFHTIKNGWKPWMKYLPPIGYSRKKWCLHLFSRAMNTLLNAVGKVQWCRAKRSSIQRSLTTAVAAHSITKIKSSESWLALVGDFRNFESCLFAAEFQITSDRWPDWVLHWGRW